MHDFFVKSLRIFKVRRVAKDFFVPAREIRLIIKFRFYISIVFLAQGQDIVLIHGIIADKGFKRHYHSFGGA